MFPVKPLGYTRWPGGFFFGVSRARSIVLSVAKDDNSEVEFELAKATIFRAAIASMSMDDLVTQHRRLRAVQRDAREQMDVLEAAMDAKRDRGEHSGYAP